jgi:MOSC domain-containing protein YiiM
MGSTGRVTGDFVGGVETFVAPDGKPMTTGIRKRPVARALLGAGGFAGDACTEADHHAPNKTVHLFATEHHPVIAARCGLTLPRPAFGENILATGIGEGDVCVGDHLRIGAAVVCVTQPTERCKAIGRSLGYPKVLKIMHELEACGFYARVVAAGEVAAGDGVSLVARTQPTWTILRLHRLMFKGLGDVALVDEALAINELSAEWKRRLLTMRDRHRRGEPLSSSLAEL